MQGANMAAPHVLNALGVGQENAPAMVSDPTAQTRAMQQQQAQQMLMQLMQQQQAQMQPQAPMPGQQQDVMSFLKGLGLA